MKKKNIVKFVADDGKEFDSKNECVEYERKLEEMRKYEEERSAYRRMDLKDKVKFIHNKFDKVCGNRRMDNDDLMIDGQEQSVRGDIDFVENWEYGVVSLRDDAVDVLFEYIDELEKKK
jgi:hypothetical protein